MSAFDAMDGSSAGGFSERDQKLATLSDYRRAGVEFIDENAGGAGVRLQKQHQTPKRK
jgi:hypothetical protein